MNDNTLYMEVKPNPEGDGFLYLAYIDEEDRTLEIGSGHADTLPQAMRSLTGLAERTL